MIQAAMPSRGAWLLVLSIVAVFVLGGCGGSGSTHGYSSAIMATAITRILAVPASSLCPSSAKSLCGHVRTTPYSIGADSRGTEIAVTYRNGTVAVWRLRSGELASGKSFFGVLGNGDNTVQASLSADGKYLGIADAGYGGPGEVTLWSLGRRKLIWGTRYPTDWVAFSPDDTMMLIVPNEIANAHRVYALRISQLSGRSATSANDSMLSVPDPPRTDPNSVQAAGYDARSGSFTIGGVNIAFSDQSSAGTYGYMTWKPGRTATVTNPGGCLTTALSLDGAEFACISLPTSMGGLGEAKVWRATPPRQIAVWPLDSGIGVTTAPTYDSLTFLDGSREIAISEGEHTPSGSEGRIAVFRVHDHVRIRTLTFSVPNQYYVTALYTVGNVLVADTPSGWRVWANL
jgi:hypothetical protein